MLSLVIEATTGGIPFQLAASPAQDYEGSGGLTTFEFFLLVLFLVGIVAAVGWVVGKLRGRK
jgi:hypothetical protein